MRKTTILVFTALLIMLFFSTSLYADSSYKKSVWPSQLQNGTLKVRGPGYGSWGTQWITVDTGVSGYQEVGTSKGPVLLYNKGKQWRVIMMDFNTGAKSNASTFNAPTTIFRGGVYGAILKSGSQCYDFSWNQLNQTACK